MKENVRFTRNGNTVRVTLPVHIANDINQVQQVVANLASRLGHNTCFSGFDVYFQQEVEAESDPEILEL